MTSVNLSLTAVLPLLKLLAECGVLPGEVKRVCMNSSNETIQDITILTTSNALYAYDFQSNRLYKNGVVTELEADDDKC